MHGRRIPDMTERELNQKIQTALEHAAPDQLERILSSCDQTLQATDAPKKGALTSMTDIRNDKNRKSSHKKRSPLAAIAAVAAAFALVIGGFAMTRPQSNPEIDSIILLDVNPSLSLSVDTQEIVRAVDPRNDEARDVLGTMDLTGTSLEVSVNALIGAMMQKGYLDDAHNSILVSVENKDSARGITLQQKVSQAITSAMHTDTMDAAVLSQCVDPDDGILAQLSQTHNISMGKAALIQEVITQDPTLTFEKLAPLSINDIALIASSKEMTSQTVTQTGTASDKAYIGRDAALEKALVHAGVTASDAKRIHVEFDSDDGLMIYEIEFETTDLEYDYDINARTGDVIRHEFEALKEKLNELQKEVEDARIPSSSQADTSSPTESGTKTPTPSVSGSDSYISESVAFSAALSHAGVSANDIREKEVKLDKDDGKVVYEIEWKSGRTEYDYEVDAITGQILKAEKDIDD